ncbi:hypothetical protein [Priestia taiwanensis]|uniref:Uncharacterized protein n=1 Tax=Priestia taiwanensis TaxID=1347902 RepID=A0A917APN4_9BACI|nr:hypothetical protein [Priestia taiwanensis]MBM7362727.1 hypothetical protein [Priestia taiwanensis]GGE64599.1 hypothetical protein GCM10007140_13510 [Priestia taiwanensis]
MKKTFIAILTVAALALSMGSVGATVEKDLRPGYVQIVDGYWDSSSMDC